MNPTRLTSPNGLAGTLSLHCPQCGDGETESYLHLRDFDKVGESVSLTYWCEFCHESSVLQLDQQKGNTRVYWQVIGKPILPRLTGQSLLDRVKELGNVPASQAAKDCGYVTPAKSNGKQRPALTKFYEALLIAKGVDLEALKEAHLKTYLYPMPTQDL